MNQKGFNIVIALLIVFAVALILPPLLLYLFPQAMFLFQIIGVFLVYSTIRTYLGPGPLTLILSAIFIYFLVFKYPHIFSSVWAISILMMMNFTGVLFWSTSAALRMNQQFKEGWHF